MISTLLKWLQGLVTFNYKNKREKDKVLVELFLKELPAYSSSVEFLKERDVAAPVHYSVLTKLDEVAEKWKLPDKKFQVKKLERLKFNFIEKLEIFLDEYSQHSGSCSGDLLSIGIRDYETRKFKLEAKATLNKLARVTYNTYEKFVETARSEI